MNDSSIILLKTISLSEGKNIDGYRRETRLSSPVSTTELCLFHAISAFMIFPQHNSHKSRRTCIISRNFLVTWVEVAMLLDPHEVVLTNACW
jgi:hypothetical protein